MSNTTSIFGAVRTGYIVVSTKKLDEWKRFGAEALGLHMDVHGPGAVSFRMDDHAQRLIVRKGQTEDVAAIGLEVTEREALDEILRRLRAHRVVVEEKDGAEAATRGTERFWRVLGPKRQVIEIFEKPKKTNQPLNLGVSGFHTGAAGLGHIAITSKEPQAAIGFWKEIFDARQSDLIEEKMPGATLLITFLRFNERHHSIAIAGTKGVKLDPIPTRIQHLAFEVLKFEDVAAAYVRCIKLGFKIALSIGQHTNDRAVSFYVISPSGFEVEMSWNPLSLADDTDWDDTVVHEGISIWGHDPVDVGIREKLGLLRAAVQSAFRNEYQAF
jgi:2,3-dihydroxybiphenyl 1,2-dioxygenase